MSNTGQLVMTKTELDLRGFQRWMGQRRIDDHDLALHRLLKEGLGDTAPKPFYLDWHNRSLLGYGTADAAILTHLLRIYADPSQASLFRRIDSKVMPKTWAKGQTLGFKVRVIPVTRVARKRDDTEETRGLPKKEMDAFVIRSAQVGPDTPLERGEVYGEWLSEQMAPYGVEVVSSRMTGFAIQRVYRKQEGRRLERPDVEMRGVLRIGDPEGFRKLLGRGVGRHLAYGFGMLLLRPPRKGDDKYQ